MEVKALLKTTGKEVSGYWMHTFDEYALVTENDGIIPLDKLEGYEVVPWLPNDHFCQPYLIEGSVDDTTTSS